VDNQFLGATLKCGKCTQPFTVRAMPTQPADRPIVKMSIKPSVDEEIDLVLDGPAAAALLQPPPPKAAPPAATFHLDIGSATSPGRVRKRNEDSFMVQKLAWTNLDQRHELALVIVADGLGGHEAGDQASGMAVRLIGASLAPLFSSALSGQIVSPDAATVAESIDRAIKEANRAVYRRGQTEPRCKGMGATGAVVLVWDGQVQIGHVGDCRVYHYQAGQAVQITRDQTLVMRMVELGQLTPKEALTHPARTEVTQAIGNQSEIAPAAYQLTLTAGDWLIVASDGLHTHVDIAVMQDAIRKSVPSAGALAHHLVELVNHGGGSDNCTVAAIRCYGPG
jgi:protein phosphatase